jgi:hypothetical protein
VPLASATGTVTVPVNFNFNLKFKLNDAMHSDSESGCRWPRHCGGSHGAPGDRYFKLFNCC